MAPSSPGTAVDLGNVAAGTQLGFFLVADGFQLNDQSQFQGGSSSCAMAATSPRWRAWTTGRPRCWSMSRATS